MSLEQTNGHQTSTCQILTACLKLILKHEVYLGPLVLKFKAISSLKKYQTSRGASITADLESHQKGS